MKKKQILVCGTGFGKIYLKAIAESKEYACRLEHVISEEAFEKLKTSVEKKY